MALPSAVASFSAFYSRRSSAFGGAPVVDLASFVVAALKRCVAVGRRFRGSVLW